MTLTGTDRPSTPDRRWRVLGIALLAAAIAGSITGTQLTIEDEAWPGRGGYEAVVQISLLFTLYALVVTVPLGALLSATLAPFMARRGLDRPLPHLMVGLATGTAAHLLVDVAIRERIDGAEDFVGGMVAGGVAGLLWWNGSRRDQEKAEENG